MRGYRVPAPAAADLVAWPAAFGTRFTLFVDTEEEFDWSLPPSQAARSVTAIRALPAANRRFADHGVVPTYLVDHPVVADARAVATLAPLVAAGSAAIGTQLHPWVNPPFDGVPDESYPGNLPRGDEAAKLDVLTEAIATAFGRRPLAYRAGRYGIGADTLALLAERGYRVDSSVRARYDYRGGGGPDFREIGNAAYRCGPRSALIEVPLTTVFTGALRAGGPMLDRWAAYVPRGRGALARAGLLSRVALTPEDMPIAEALEAIEVAAADGLRLLNFSFHSPSLEPGHTPYVRDAAGLARFWRWWDAVLARLDRLGIAPASLNELLAAADAAG